jgi:hypothetical protein
MRGFGGDLVLPSEIVFLSESVNVSRDEGEENIEIQGDQK